MTVGVRIQADGALAGIHAARGASRSEVAGAVTRAGVYARTAVRANASTGTHPPGRPHIPGTGPGPNVGTGAYRGGMSVTNHEAHGSATSEVSTAAVQAARLEYGFIGRDSAGRYYTQPAYPHWEPATPLVETFADQQMDQAGQAIIDAFGGTHG